MKSKHPGHHMVFGVVTSNGDVIPLFTFQHGLRLNTETFIKCLVELILTWIAMVAAESPNV